MQSYAKQHSLIFLLVFLTMLTGCWLNLNNDSCNASILAETLISGTHGSQIGEAAATWVSDTVELQAVYKMLNKHRVGSELMPPEVDFKEFGILYIQMAQQPTGGFSIEFESVQKASKANQAIIIVKWNQPQKDEVVTQSITTPYLLVKIQHCDFESLLVKDQNDQILFEVMTP